MYKKVITYTDYNGTERTESFYFNLTKAEIIEMEYGSIGGLTQAVSRIIEAQDTPTLVKIFKDLILRSYGVKSLDGKRFEKSEQLSNEFSQTEAYSQLFMELATDDEKAADFLNGIVPADVAEKAKELRASGETPQELLQNLQN